MTDEQMALDILRRFFSRTEDIHTGMGYLSVDDDNPNATPTLCIDDAVSLSPAECAFVRRLDAESRKDTTT